ncbi:MAG TPA: exonuclease domain-containing protein [Candidatus Paceibacterota bacterium]
MIVIDMESTGVDPIKHSLLSLGAVDFKNPKNQFYMECRAWEGAHIDDEALLVNGFSKEQAFDQTKATDRELVEKFLTWVEAIPERTLAGQHPATDRDFLKYTCFRHHINWPFAQRSIDLHTVAYYHMIKRGVSIPLKNGHSALNLDAILRYVGMETEPRPHNGLTGAKVEAETFSRLFYGKSLLSDYERLPLPDFLKL